MCLNCHGQHGTTISQAGRAPLVPMQDQPHCPIAAVQPGRGCAFFDVLAYMQILVVGGGLYESTRQTVIAVVAADTASDRRFGTHERASQIVARLIRNGQARRAMRVEFPARFFNCLAATSRSTHTVIRRNTPKCVSDRLPRRNRHRPC
jgi:hypothetical protein